MLREELVRYTELFGSECAFVIKNFNTGHTFSYRDDLTVSSASLIKVPVMIEAFRQAKSGNITMDQRISVRPEEKAAYSVLEFLDPENSYTILDLIKLMIIYSDNTAANLLIRLLGMDTINQCLRDLGLTSTVLRREMMDFSAREKGLENETTAGEMAELMLRLYHEKLLDPVSDKSMLEILKGQADECMMRVDLPDDMVIARKSGELENLNHEMAIVYGEKSNYLYVFFVWDSRSNNESRQILQKTSKLVFDYFEI